MKTSTFKIAGIVVDATTKKRLANLRVEAWDAQRRHNAIVASGTTDTSGTFEMNVTAKKLASLFGEQRPDLYFKVLAGEELLADTSGEIHYTFGAASGAVEIAVRGKGGRGGETGGPTRKVRGRITDATGAGHDGLTVIAVDKGVDMEVSLVATTTGSDGSYLMEYPSDSLTKPEAGPDLIVRVYKAKGDAEAVASSPLILNAGVDELINLLYDDEPYRGPSEFEQVGARLNTHLAKVDLANVDARGVAVLASLSGLEAIPTAHYVKARREASRTSLSAEALYGLYRMNLPTSVAGLASQDTSLLERTVERAASANLVSRGAATKAAATIAHLGAIGRTAALSDDDAANTTVRRTLALAGMSAAEGETFLRSYAGNTGSMPEFWSSLRGDLGEDKTRALQRTLQLTALSLNNPSLVEVLTTSESRSAAIDPVGLDASGWLELIQNNGVETPSGITGDSLEDRQATYATLLTKSVESAFPTAVLAFKWNQIDPDATIASFLSVNPTFVFGTQRVTSYLAANPTALDGIEDQEAAVSDLLAVERLYRIAPATEKFEHIYPLFENNVRSASAIKVMGRSAFMRSFADADTELALTEMYTKAVRVADVSLATYLKYGPALNNIPMYSVAEYTGPSTDDEGGPDLESLFGSPDYCACEHCVSVLGPSAYLTDLFVYLNNAAAADDQTGLEKLFERRPDLGNIDLTCENSDTKMPYIDLVNEVLENAIHPIEYTDTTYDGITLPVSGDVPQTEATAEELAANPEHLNPAAYDTLAASGSVYPWSLPFSLWREEAAVYLEHLGVPRYELIELFRPEDTVARAAEYLGLLNPDDAGQTDEVVLLTTPSVEDAALEGVWGVPAGDLAALGNVLTLSEHAELEYRELRDLLETLFVNGDGTLTIVFGDDEPCSLTDAAMSGLTNEHLDRIHRFVRLQRRLEWSSHELDKALTACFAEEITEDVLVWLAGVRELRLTYDGVAFDRLLSWWGASIDVVAYEDEPSLYEQVFLNQAVHQLDAISDIFELTDDRSELRDGSRSLNDAEIGPLVRAAVSMSESDLLLLVEEELGGDDAMTLGSLSLLYRVALFCKTLDVTVTDYLTLKRLTGIRALTDAGGAATPTDTIRFIEIISELSAAEITIETLDYLLCHSYSATSVVPPQETETSVLLDEIRTEMQTIRADKMPGEDEVLRGVLEDRLSLVFKDDADDVAVPFTREEKVQLALGILDRTSTMSTVEQEAFIDDNLGTFIADLAIAKDTLLAELPGDAADAAIELDARYTFLLTPVLEYIVPIFMEEYLILKIAAERELEGVIVADLLRTYLSHPSDTAAVAIDYFKSDAFVDTTEAVVNAAPFADGFTILEQVYKIAIVVNSLGVTSDDVPFILGKGIAPEVGWIDLASLPLVEASDDVARSNFSAWYKLFRTYQVQKNRFGEAYSVVALIERANDPSVSRETIQSDLSAQTGWDESDIETLIGSDGFDVRFASDGGSDTDEVWLTRLDEAFEHVERLGVSAATMMGWASDGVSFAQAVAIKTAAKAKYDNDEWLEVAGNLRDELRERQRDALQAYVMYHDGFEDADALYAHYLIDSEMSACMMTSRIVQAISSVQLFVQRILMNLEAEQIEFTQDDADEWEWRRTYRVWEANRKVFLYPENWIEPELRDTKTPFFKELENELQQSEVTDTSVETAYLTYLKRLEEVAHLNVRATCYDEENDVTHVFARTSSAPYTYFYRTWREVDGYWTAWEELDLKIENDHLVPFIYNRRLYLCWAELTARAEKVPASEEPADATEYYELRLAWSEYRNGQWGPSHVSEEYVSFYMLSRTVPSVGRGNVLPDLNNLALVPELDSSSNSLRIYCTYHASLRITGTHGASRMYDAFAFGYFLLAGCHESFVAITMNEDEYYEDDVYLPESSIWDYTSAISDGAEALRLNVSSIATGSSDRVVTVLEEAQQFRVVIPANLLKDYNAQAPLFYSADRRTYFVNPGDAYDVNGSADASWDFDLIDPGTIDVWVNKFIPTVEATDGDTGVADVPVREWYTDPVRGDTIFDGRLGDTLVINRADRVVVNEGSGEMTAPRLATNGTSRAMVSMKEAGGTSELSRFTIPSVDAILGEAGVYSWGGFRAIWNARKFTFVTFYHPYVCTLIEHLNQYGIEGILAPDTRNGDEVTPLVRQQGQSTSFFESAYDPALVTTPYPIEEFDFSYAGAYSEYNWELFFHVPLMIAQRLMQNQKFEDAQKWFHYIFDPTEVEGDAPARFWKLKPFFEFSGETTIAGLMELLNEGDDEMEKQVAAWEADPFDPHTVARLRTVAYMRTVVMKYLDNLIAWGDYLFGQESMESINEATQIYVLASQILGRKPEEIETEESESFTFNQLFPNLDGFSNALVEIESGITVSTEGLVASPQSTGSSTVGSVLYFCIPTNTELLAYWDTVEDRLYKIRHCMNIAGVTRQLALYQPPIDPAMLVRAAASGVDLSSALGDLYAPLPAYRFNFMVAKAVELARDAQSLGAALLAALEKKDAEELGILRAGHERDLLKAMEDVKTNAVKEAESTKSSLERTKAQAEARQAFYTEREQISAAEAIQIALQGEAMVPEAFALASHVGASAANLFPSFSFGGAGVSSPIVSTSYGGSNVAGALGSYAAAMSTLAGMLNGAGGIVGLLASYERRQEDWTHQAELATIEIEQLEYQIEAADVRISMAKKDLENHQLQIENSNAVYDYLKGKYTNRDLYSWMVTQVSTLYFQAYQLAYETAKRAERAFRHEIGTYGTNFIQFGYWDSLKKGLLSGERLLKDIRRMEMAYIDQNKREFELTKHVSLAQVNPQALIDLRQSGSCEFSIPEALFDLDFPGQYMRRIKTMAITIPCVAGPYTTIAATLTLLSSRIRVDSSTAASYRYTGIGDARFLHDLVGIQSIATSNAQRDAGLFELSFRDERYLPFEGAGAVSTWRLELPAELRQFDYDAITDAILHMSYTARDGGDALRATVESDLVDSMNTLLDVLSHTETGLPRLISLRHDFSNEFYQLLHPQADAPQQVTITLGTEHFPYVLRERAVDLLPSGVTVYIKQKDAGAFDISNIKLAVRGTDSVNEGSTQGDLSTLNYAITGDPLGDWLFEVDSNGDPLEANKVEDVLVLLTYTIS